MAMREPLVAQARQTMWQAAPPWTWFPPHCPALRWKPDRQQGR